MAIKKTRMVEAVNLPNASHQQIESHEEPDAIGNYEFEAENDASVEIDNRAFDIADPSNSPYVTVNKIVLEPTGGDIIPENNPHIDDIQGANTMIDEFGNVQFVSKQIDYLTKTVTPAGLLVNLQLSIKEIIKAGDVLFERASGETIVVQGKTGQGTWYDHPDYLKYLNIRVVESTHEQLTNKLQSREYSLNPREFAESGLRKYATEKIISIENEIDKDINKYESFRNEAGERIYDVTFDVSFFHNKTDPGHLTYFVQTFLDVDQISADFGCGGGNIQALGLDRKTGPIVAERVVDKGAVSKNSFVFYTPENKIWVGPVHYHPEKGFMAGSEHTRQPHPTLRRAVVKNSKIEDQRDSLNAERAEIEFSIIENQLLDLRLTSLERSVADVKRMTEYFSDIFGTRDAHGRFRCVFGMNYQKILRDKTEFGKMFTNPNLSVVEGLAASCKLSFVKIVRERVEDLETLTNIGTVVHGRTPFGANALGTVTISVPKKTIVYSSAVPGERLRAYTRRITSTGQAAEDTEKNKTIRGGLTTDGILREVELFPTLETDIRHFAFADHDVSRATDGLYRYGVEISIEDGTKDYLISISKRLLRAKKKLLLYYNKASGRTNGKRNYNNTSKKYSQAFINLMNSQYPRLREGRIRGSTEVIYEEATNAKRPRHTRQHKHSYLVDTKGNGRTSTVGDHYHSISNFKIGPAIPVKSRRAKGRRSKSRIRGHHTHASYVVGSYRNAPWIDPVIEYLEVLDIFSAGRHNINIFKLHAMLNTMLTPETGNPEGILRLVKLIDNLYTKIDNVTGDPAPVGRKASTIGKSAHRRFIRFEKMFDEIFDSDIPKKTGFDYLGMQETQFQEAGLYMVDGKTYVQRAREETKKYENDQASAAANELSFLGPAKININNSVIDMMVTPFENLFQMEEIEAKILEYNINPVRASSIGPVSLSENDAAKSTKKSMMAFFEGLSVKVADITDKSDEGVLMLYPLTMTLQRCIENSRTYLGNDSLMVSRNMNVEKLIGDKGKTPEGLAVESDKTANKALSLIAAPIKNSAFNPAITNQSPFAMSTKSFDIAKFDITTPNNYHATLSQAEKSALPNQLGIMLRPNNLILSRYQQAVTDNEQEKMESALRLNVQLLKYVEVFTGYVIKEDGTKLIKYPRWTKLTYTMYNEGVGRIMLCRLSNYNNNTVGATFRELLSIPSYNEYFFLRPTDTESVAGGIDARNPLKQNRERVNRNNRSIRPRLFNETQSAKIPANRIHSNLLVIEDAEAIDDILEVEDTAEEQRAERHRRAPTPPDRRSGRGRRGRSTMPGTGGSGGSSGTGGY